jgi:hypothetical protein
MITTMDPPVGNPALMFLGRTIPAAGRPDVMVTFITVIAVDPHITPIGRRPAAFVNGRRRTDANRDLRKHCRRA